MLRTAAGLFFYLTKAFDTIDHDIFLKKISNTGTQGSAGSPGT